MRIEDLQYFIRVAETGSISQVAQKHYITQQGLSRIISSLESELDVKLLHRGKNLRLTAAGRVLLEDARAVEAAYLRMVDNANCFSARWVNARGSIYTIYATPVICATVLSGIVTTLNKRFPGMFFNVVERLPLDIARMKDPGPRSLAVLSIPAFLREETRELDEENCRFEMLFSDEICVSVAADHPLAAQSVATMEMISKMPIVIHNSEILMIRHLMGEAYREERITHTTNHSLCRDMVRQGMTVGLTSDLIQYASQDDVVAVPLQEKVRIQYGCVRWPGEDPNVEEIVRVIRETFRQVERATTL